MYLVHTWSTNDNGPNIHRAPEAVDMWMEWNMWTIDLTTMQEIIVAVRNIRPN